MVADMRIDADFVASSLSQPGRYALDRSAQDRADGRELRAGWWHLPGAPRWLHGIVRLMNRLRVHRPRGER